jgi:hypothetical protein
MEEIELHIIEKGKITLGAGSPSMHCRNSFPNSSAENNAIGGDGSELQD